MYDVAVVIAVYNRTLQLERALNSVKNQQTSYSMEVFVVDDCSDCQAEIANLVLSFSARLNITLLRHSTNRGGGAARNTGITQANAKYIAFLDSDDEWHESKIEQSLDFLKSQPECDVVYSKLQRVGVQRGVFPARGLLPGENVMDYLLVNGGSIQTSTMVIKREVYEKCFFDETLKRFQDYDFVFSLMLSKKRIEFIDKILVFLHDDDQSNRISNSVDPRPAEIWYQKVHSVLSPRARAHFRVKRLCHYYSQSGKKLSALKILCSIDTFRHVHLAIITKELLLVALPVNMIKVLRHLRRHWIIYSSLESLKKDSISSDLKK